MSNVTTRNRNANTANNVANTSEQVVSTPSESTTAADMTTTSTANAAALAAAAAVAATANPDAMNFSVVTGSDMPVIDELQHHLILKCETRLRGLPTRTVESLQLNKLMPERIQDLVGLHLQAAEIPDAQNWRSWDILKKLLPILKQIILPNNAKVALSPMDHVNSMRKALLYINLYQMPTLHKVITMLCDIINLPAVMELTPELQRPLVVRLITIMHDTKTDNLLTLRLKEKVQEKDPQTLEEFKTVYFMAYMALRRVVHEAEGLVNAWSKGNRVDSQQQREKSRGENKRPRSETHTEMTPTASELCTGCGRHHDVSTCILRDHPDFNKESTSWLNSTKGKAWAAKQGRPVEHLPWKATLSGQSWSAPELPPKSGNNKSGNKYNNKREYIIPTLFDVEPHLLNAIQYHEYSNNDTLPCNIQVESAKQVNIPARALLDSGALHGDYINTALADKLQEAGIEINKNKSTTICNAFGDCRLVVGMINITVTLSKMNTHLKCSCSNRTEKENENEKIQLNCTVIESPYELIIGRPSMQKYDLFVKLHNHLMNTPNQQQNAETAVPSVETLAAVYKQSLPSVEKQYERAHMTKFIHFDPEAEGISYPFAEQTPHEETPENENKLPQIFGDKVLKQKLTDLCTEFADIFSSKVRKEPADLPPFTINCDTAKWNSNKNKGPPRVQSAAKQAETIRQINEMLKLNVIRKSQASSYSQVHLVPKQNSTKMRFCIDYRNLNDCCTKSGWPIPNIKAMFARLGAAKPKPQYYGKIDLTSGYHQAPLSLQSSILTAFITIIGVYEWLRVPMGPKGAPSYFQEIIQTVVLAGLIYAICEAYLDDILVYAATPEDLVARLRLVFERFRKHKLTINPEKCFLGMQEVEFVGHLLTADGITFTRNRIDNVLNIPPPKYEKDMKSFIGIINYFHDHIRDHSMLVRPLQQLVLQYTPSKKIQWTSEALTAFNAIKDAINNCPTLSFVNDTAPIYLHTDASDYGMGAYLFQVVNGKEIPIAFMSKAFDARECGWSTPEKECYAIYYTLVKFEYLLRDVHFTIRTDHKNLTYMNDSVNRKVYNWKLKIQHFDFDIEYLPGELNTVADGFSRILVSENNKNETVNDTVDDSDNAEYINIIDELKLDAETFRKIDAVHNCITGHHGVERTFNKLVQSGHHWFKMREHVKKFIKQCPACQKMSVIKTPIHTHPFTAASYGPWERLNIDTIGPMTPDEEGNQYILVIIDCFTRFVELYVTKDATAITAAYALLNHMGTFGCPQQILTDNGPQFANELIKELTTLVDTEHIRTIAYSHEENAIVERVNKEIVRHLRAIILDKNVIHQWSKCVPFVKRIINASYESSINTTPATLLFGNVINLDRGIFLPFSNNANNANKRLSAWTADMLHLQQAVISAAERHQRDKDQSHLIAADPKRTEFPNNSFVLISYPISRHASGSTNKLKTHKKGPMKVISHEGNTYTVENLVTHKLEKYNVTQLSNFVFDETRVDPTEIANKDMSASVVESIISHEPVKANYAGQRVSEMSFRVRWRNLTEDYDRILPWKELRNNPALHQYLRNNNMERLIPREHRN